MTGLSFNDYSELNSSLKQGDENVYRDSPNYKYDTFANMKC